MHIGESGNSLARFAGESVHLGFTSRSVQRRAMGFFACHVQCRAMQQITRETNPCSAGSFLIFIDMPKQSIALAAEPTIWAHMLSKWFKIKNHTCRILFLCIATASAFFCSNSCNTMTNFVSNSRRCLFPSEYR